MAQRNYAEHARVTAICVNLALEGVEADIHHELERATDEAALALRRVLARMKSGGSPKAKLRMESFECDGTAAWREANLSLGMI